MRLVSESAVSREIGVADRILGREEGGQRILAGRALICSLMSVLLSESAGWDDLGSMTVLGNLDEGLRMQKTGIWIVCVTSHPNIDPYPQH